MVLSEKTKKKNQKKLVAALYEITQSDLSEIKFQDISWDAEKPVLKLKGINETPNFTVTFEIDNDNPSLAHIVSDCAPDLGVDFDTTNSDYDDFNTLILSKPLVRMLAGDIFMACSFMMCKLGINCYLAQYEGDEGFLEFTSANELQFLSLSTKVSFEIDIKDITDWQNLSKEEAAAEFFLPDDSVGVHCLINAIIIETDSDKVYLIYLDQPDKFEMELDERINKVGGLRKRINKLRNIEPRLVTHKMKKSGNSTSHNQTLSEEDQRQAFSDKHMPLLEKALKSIKKSLRDDARADKYVLFREHMRKLGLPERPTKPMIDMTVELVETSLLSIPHDQQTMDRTLHLLSLQRYNLSEVPDARFVLTFNIFGETCGRVVLDKDIDYLGPDLYDLFECSWDSCDSVGYYSLFISHPDWSRITNHEFKRLEQDVTFDLRFDGDHDIQFSFHRDPDALYLEVTVWDIQEKLLFNAGSEKFKLIQIRDFDARHGYKRCTLPGVGAHCGRRSATSDFWKDRTGKLVVRFSNYNGYTYHFKALTASGKQIPDDKMDDFGEYVSEMLIQCFL